MTPRRLLSAEQVEAVRSLHARGATQTEIASAVGVTIDHLRARLRDQLTDLPARPRRANSGRRGIEPTAEEIAAACVEIRAGWGEERFLPEPLEQHRTTCF